MTFITERRRAHCIIYLRVNYYHWVDVPADPRGITLSAVRVTDMMYKLYIYY